MLTFKCTRCNCKFSGKDEYEAELAFDEHLDSCLEEFSNDQIMSELMTNYKATVTDEVIESLERNCDSPEELEAIKLMQATLIWIENNQDSHF